MKYSLHTIFLFLVFSISAVYSQDQLFFRKGTSLTCKIVAISEKTITYRDTIVGAPLVTVPKTEVILAEYKTGEVYIFSSGNSIGIEAPEETREQRKERKMKEWKEQEQGLSDNILGFYIPDLVLGRFTVSYERLIANKTIGITIPVSLTYDSFGALAAATSTSSSGTGTTAPVTRTRGVNIIAGIDVNYYYDLKPQLKYYFGPRLRYGTDMVFSGLEGVSFQLQNGIFKSRGKRMTSNLGFGIGFVKVFNAPVLSRDPRKVHPWASFTWRLGFRL